MHLHPSQVSPCSIRIAATNAFCRLYTCTASFLHINALGELHSPVGTTKKNSPLEKRQLHVVFQHEEFNARMEEILGCGINR